MAKYMNTNDLKESLNNPVAISEQEFDIVKNIGLLVNDPNKSDIARELVLRALEHRKSFHATRPILEALTRAVGYSHITIRSNLAYVTELPTSTTALLIWIKVLYFIVNRQKYIGVYLPVTA